MAASTVVGNKQVDQLHAEFERLAVRGYWQPRAEPPKPKARLWRWLDIYPLLMRTAEVINLGEDSARRFIGLQTETQTLSFGFQVVMPGESAEAHHHTPSALRFVVQGQGAYTTSNGEPMSMSPGDMLTQPNWVWHDHNNNTANPMIWIDSLDAGVVRMLNARFFEKWPDGRVQPLVRPPGYSAHRYGPLGAPSGADWAVPFHYKWPDTLKALQLMADEGTTDPHDGVLLEYKNPVTGGHTMRNTTCYIQMLRPGERTKPHRHTGVWIYHVYEGSGLTLVGRDAGKRTELVWQEKDAFVVPSWEWHHHENLSDRPAFLFSVCDRPIIEAAGLWREERGAE